MIAGVALIAALAGGSYLARDLIEGGAATPACRGVARGWTGVVRGPRISATRPALERAVFREINAYRRSRGLPVLARVARLNWLARYWSDGERSRQTMEHERAGRDAFTVRFARYTPSPCVAEVLAEGYSTARLVVAAWVRSPGHRHVLELAWVRRVGVGVSGRYVVADFDAG